MNGERRKGPGVAAAEAVFRVAALLFGREAIPRLRRFFDPGNWSCRPRKA